MKIIKIFPINSFCSCTKLSLIDNFIILQKRPVEGFLKETNGKNWEFSVENKGRGKTGMVKAAKSCHQAKFTQKT